MTISRRSLIAGGAGAGLLLTRPARALTGLTALAQDPGGVFTSGVASGDPSETGVVLWTRVAAPHVGSTVAWELWNESDPGSIVRSGTAVAAGDRGGSLQVVVEGLAPGERWGYRFSLAGNTIVGRTKTLPSDPTSLRIGVVSCSKYADGYFNAYRALAAMDLDLVVHLGDYIYASGTSPTTDPLGRWDPIPSRYHLPNKECRRLADYRTRYEQYRSDPDAQLLHASVPVVAIWDDNDIANNAYRDGNQEGETGSVWAARKADAIRAWSEFHPTRVDWSGGEPQIWRRIRSGRLLDLFMLDTRLQRDEQVSNAAAASNARNDDPTRTMLGPDQLAWLTTALASDDAAWRVIGQSVVMTHWRVLGGPEDVMALRREVSLVHDTSASQAMADGGVYWNSDGWDGYAHERGRLLDAFGAASGDVVVLTGDVHSSWANELVPHANYLNGSVGVEFVTPAVSTRSFAQNVYGATPPFEAMFTAVNPWIKQCDMDANGFCVVTLTEDRAIAQWHQVDAQTPGAPSSPLMAWQTMRGTNTLVPYLGV